MEELRKIDKRSDVQVVTDNTLIDAQDLPKLSLNARKLFYIAVSQCRKSDTEFYCYETTPSELAEMWGVSRQEVYQVALKICRELMKIVITLPNGKKGFKLRHLFEICNYDESTVVFKLHSEMTDLLLGLKRDFSKPYMWDFMKMRSPYSMAIWHLMQREMRGFKPMMTSSLTFDITLEELRRVTGCENKLKQIGQFKARVLDKALVEIRKNCMTDIKYTNKKRGRTVVGFEFTAQSVFGHIDVNELSRRDKQRMRRAQLIRKKSEGQLTAEEDDELQELILILDQMTLEDWMNSRGGGE